MHLQSHHSSFILYLPRKTRSKTIPFLSQSTMRAIHLLSFLLLQLSTDALVIPTQILPQSLVDPSIRPHQNRSPTELLQHQANGFDYPISLTAGRGQVDIQQRNTSIASVQFTLDRLVLVTKRWVLVRETGKRGDTRPIQIWIRSCRGTISNVLSGINPKTIAADATVESVIGRLYALDVWLQDLQEKIGTDGNSRLLDLAQVAWVSLRTLPTLNEIRGSLKWI